MWPPSSSKTVAGRDSARGRSEPILVDAPSAAAALSISERAFHSLRKRPDFPKHATVVLGPRCVRFRLDALCAFTSSLVAIPQSEPRQLQQSRKVRSENRLRAKASSEN